MIKKSFPRAACTTSGKTRNLAYSYLSRRERKSIHYGCQIWSCCDTAQSPLTSTMSSRNHYAISDLPESSMLQEEPVVHPKTQEDAGTTRLIPKNPFLNLPSDQSVTDHTRSPHLDDVNALPQSLNTRVDDPESSPRLYQDKLTDVLPVQSARELQNSASTNNYV